MTPADLAAAVARALTALQERKLAERKKEAAS